MHQINNITLSVHCRQRLDRTIIRSIPNDHSLNSILHTLRYSDQIHHVRSLQFILILVTTLLKFLPFILGFTSRVNEGSKVTFSLGGKGASSLNRELSIRAQYWIYRSQRDPPPIRLYIRVILRLLLSNRIWPPEFHTGISCHTSTRIDIR
jgi:hypothetical protein